MLGVHIVGPESAEIIQGIAIAMKCACSRAATLRSLLLRLDLNLTVAQGVPVTSNSMLCHGYQTTLLLVNQYLSRTLPLQVSALSTVKTCAGAMRGRHNSTPQWACIPRQQRSSSQCARARDE